MPPPDPRSSTVSPGFNSASAVGLPQPNEAFTAASGSADFCESSYKSRVIGSISVPQQVGAQQDPASREATRRAASPYLILTVSLTVSVLIVSSHLPWRIRRNICSRLHICQAECIMSSMSRRANHIVPLEQLFRALADPT